MDPNRCLAMIQEAREAGHDDVAMELKAELRSWVDRGGFEPSDPDWRYA